MEAEAEAEAEEEEEDLGSSRCSSSSSSSTVEIIRQQLDVNDVISTNTTPEVPEFRKEGGVDSQFLCPIPELNSTEFPEFIVMGIPLIYYLLSIPEFRNNL